MKRDHKRNEDILDKQKTKPMTEYSQNYQWKWSEHVKMTNTGNVQI